VSTGLGMRIETKCTGMRMRIEMKCIGIGITIETKFQLDVNLNFKPPKEEDVYCYDLH